MVTRYPQKKFQTPHVSQYAIPKNAFFIWKPPVGPYMYMFLYYSVLYVTVDSMWQFGVQIHTF